MVTHRLNLFLFSILLIALSNNVVAQAPHGSGHGEDKATMKTKMASASNHSKNNLHMFSSVWTQTLSDEQKIAIDKMHLEVAKVEKLLRARIQTIKIELNLLAIAEKADIAAINKKIDEITTLEASVMRNRFAHIVEMREALTPQQRTSYDMSILKRDNKKNSKKSH